MKQKISPLLKDIVGIFGKEVLNDKDKFKAVIDDVLYNFQDKEMCSFLATIVTEFNDNICIGEKHHSSMCKSLVDKLTKQGFQGFCENDIREAVCEICRILGIEETSYLSDDINNSNNISQLNKYTAYLSIAQKAYDECKESRNEVFISYSHKNKDIANDLIKYLEQSKKKFETWHFPYIGGLAEVISEKIGQHLRKAKVVVQLLSGSYITSEYIEKVERPMINEAEKDGLKRIWLYIEECDYEEVRELFAINILNGIETPLDNLRNTTRRRYYKRVAEECKGVFGVLNKS